MNSCLKRFRSALHFAHFPKSNQPFRDQRSLKHLVFERPLAVIDVETTGTDPKKDRIVEIGIRRVQPDGQVQERARRLNPGIPIPPEATAIHRITDADVANEPPFLRVAKGLLAFLEGCDFCGYNLRFDLRFLYQEFGRAGLTLDLRNRTIIDPMQIFHAYEPRNLTAAVKFYCGRDHDGCHQAGQDAAATLEVLDAMLARYENLPRRISEIGEMFKDPNAVDVGNFFTKVQGEIRFAQGKHRGQPLVEIARRSPDYLHWMLDQDFFDDTKAVVRDALKLARQPSRAH